jgi:hypothetical protein
MVATPAMGLVIPNVAFEDDFENPADAGLRLRAHVKWGQGTGPENLNLAWGGDRAIRLKADSGNNNPSDASQTANFVAGMGGGAFPQAMTFTLQSDTANQTNIGNHLTVQLNESSGGEMGRWYGWSSNVAPRYGGNVGAGIDITDGAVHEFSIVYDFATGLTEWLHNDAVVYSLVTSAGFIAERSYVQDTNRDVQDHVYLDDMVVGYIPEPASLAMLGLGALFLRRRR